MPTKRQARMDALKERYPATWGHFLPNPWQSRRFHDYVLWDDGPDEDGNFLGHCPLHDAERLVEASGIFNFCKGILRCQADPPCHPTKKAMSLSNVVSRMTDDGGH